MIPQERAAIIDFWARKGINSQKIIDYTEELMKEVKLANDMADSITVSLGRQLLYARSEVKVLGDENQGLQKKFGKCQMDNDALELKISGLKSEVTGLKRKIFWKNVTIIGTWVAVGAATVFIIQSR